MSEATIIHQIRSHFNHLLAHGSADFGPDPSAMWLASLDTQDDSRKNSQLDKEDIDQHGRIQTPDGVNFYWDQPNLVAACLLSQITGDMRYRDAAHAYVADFLARSLSHCGLLLWGNHYYYHVLRGENVWFDHQQPPEELGAHRYSAWQHELRPIYPAWGLMWQLNAEITERCIRAMSEYHIFDPVSGGFNHHADQEKGVDLLECGGILVEALAWLYTQTGDSTLRQQALDIAHYSFATRNPDTDLIPVASTTDQWHRYTCTTEVGLWAGSLIRAADYTHDDTFIEMARTAVSAYLYYGWDAEADSYFGRLNILDGTPQRDDFPEMKITPHQPDTHSNIWNSVFPSHDYPLALAETCISLFEHTRQSEFEQAIHRWASIIKQHTDDKAPATRRTAGQFGRALHFLLRASRGTAVQPLSPLGSRIGRRSHRHPVRRRHVQGQHG